MGRGASQESPGPCFVLGFRYGLAGSTEHGPLPASRGVVLDQRAIGESAINVDVLCFERAPDERSVSGGRDHNADAAVT